MGSDSRTAPAAAPNPSAKADIAFPQPRFQSPGGGGSGEPPGCRSNPAARAGTERWGWIHARHLPPPRTRRRRPTSRFPSRDFNRPGRGSGESSGCRSNPAARAATERWGRIHAPHLPPPRTRRRRPTSRFPSRDFNRPGRGIGRILRCRSNPAARAATERWVRIHARHLPPPGTRRRRPTSRFPSRDFNRPGRGIGRILRCRSNPAARAATERWGRIHAPHLPPSRTRRRRPTSRFPSRDFNRPISIARVRGRRVHACGLACAWNVRARPIRFCGTSDSRRRWTIDFRISAPPPSSDWG
jgi:hypothetical protein